MNVPEQELDPMLALSLGEEELAEEMPDVELRQLGDIMPSCQRRLKNHKCPLQRDKRKYSI